MKSDWHIVVPLWANRLVSSTIPVSANDDSGAEGDRDTTWGECMFKWLDSQAQCYPGEIGWTICKTKGLLLPIYDQVLD